MPAASRKGCLGAGTRLAGANSAVLTPRWCVGVSKTKPNDGQPAPWRHIYALEVLHHGFKGRKVRGDAPSRGCNAYVCWLGTRLQELEPDLPDPDSAAWNALGYLKGTVGTG